VSPVFSINFRREAYLREIARARARMIALGLWVAYFGLMIVILGLYGINAAMFTRRVGMIERQAARVIAAKPQAAEWTFDQGELMLIETAVENPRRWRERLSRLAEILPINVEITSVALNPQGVSGGSGANILQISGRLRTPADADRMRGVMSLIGTLQRDSVFSRGYQSIKLGSTSTSEGSGNAAEFTIECR
jgi:hypothetical protein